jgi:hypothetical protein
MSAVLNCMYSMSDAKPNWGMSNIKTMTCPSEKGKDGMEAKQCLPQAMHFKKTIETLSM